jgi:predicted small secreted protein
MFPMLCGTVRAIDDGTNRAPTAFPFRKPQSRPILKELQPMLSMKKILALMAFTTLIACETVQGAGRDMSNAGRAITAESQAVQDEL